MSVWERPEVARVFRCTHCGACCRGAEAGLTLSRAEARALARGLGLTLAAFLARHCLPGKPVRLARREGVCALWSEEGCLAWGHKPRTCSLWPFPEGLLADPAGLAAVVNSCPGFSRSATPQEIRLAARLVASHHGRARPRRAQPS